MVTVQNFSDGLVNPAVAYAVSCLGGFLALRCVRRARRLHNGAGRAPWLILAAISIGATGIWAMHFIAMLGFSIPGQEITYNVPITVESMLLSIVVCAIGLFIVGYGNGSLRRLILGGLVLGLGVNAMHYMGMAGMVISDKMTYNVPLVGLSILIAIIAGTAALWAGEHVNTMPATIGASLIAGIAVTGMHYAGMWALQIRSASMASTMSGSTAITFVVPVIVGLVVVTFGITMALMLSRTDAEVEEDRELDQRMADLARRLDEGVQQSW